MKKITILVFCILFIVACDSKEKNAKIISIRMEDQAELSDFFKGYKSVILETTDNNLIGKIDKLQLDNKYIYILDKKQCEIFIFDKTGKYQRKLSKLGRAADEYLSIEDFIIYDSNVYCLSRPNKKIFCYSHQGELREVYFLDDWYNNFTIVNDSLMYLYTEYSSNKGYNFILFNYRTNRVMERLDKYEKNQGYDFPLSPFHWCDNKLFITEQFDPTIYQLTRQGKIPFCTFDFNLLNKLPENYKTEDWTKLMDQYRFKEMFKRIEYIHISGNRLFIVYKAYYDGLGIRENIVKVNLEDNKVQVIRLNDKVDLNFPFFLNITGIYQDNLVTYAPAVFVKEHMNRLGINLPGGESLNEADNPVLFFYKFL